MRIVRRWSVSRARGLNRFYRMFEWALLKCRPVLRLVGYRRLEGPTRFVERRVKGLLFDCQMCGQCALSRTGLSCPMNCPKSLRNGPCGGVRADGNCEVVPDMRCVWVEAWRGAGNMGSTHTMGELEPPVDHRLEGASSWLRVAQEADVASVEAKAGDGRSNP